MGLLAPSSFFSAVLRSYQNRPRCFREDQTTSKHGVGVTPSLLLRGVQPHAATLLPPPVPPWLLCPILPHSGRLLLALRPGTGWGGHRQPLSRLIRAVLEAGPWHLLCHSCSWCGAWLQHVRFAVPWWLIKSLKCFRVFQSRGSSNWKADPERGVLVCFVCFQKAVLPADNGPVPFVNVDSGAFVYTDSFARAEAAKTASAGVCVCQPGRPERLGSSGAFLTASV